MTLTEYWGYSPQRIGKEAKYSVTADAKVKLLYGETDRVRWMLSTEDHPDLVKMVNAVKEKLNGQAGGAFYINEYHHVLVPDGSGGPCFFAGEYSHLLTFREEGLFVSPEAPSDLKSGDRWPGPRVGIKYVLPAGDEDVRYEKVSHGGRRRETVLLSDFVGFSSAERTARMIRGVKGRGGGPFFVNECREMFAPIGGDGAYQYLYVGRVDEDAWFPEPQRPGF